MERASYSPEAVIVRPSGELDRTATDRLIDDVRSRVTDKTEMIVISFSKTTSVRWNALCLLGRAAQAWRDATYHVVVKEARPSIRAMLGNVEGIEGAAG